MCKYCDSIVSWVKNKPEDEFFNDEYFDGVILRCEVDAERKVNFSVIDFEKNTRTVTERCPYCYADLNFKLQQALATDTSVSDKSSVSEKPNNSTDKKLGDYTLREISQVCEKLKAKYNCGACEYCPFNREFELEEGIIYECMLDYFDCLEDEKDRNEFLNKKLVDIYNVLK